MKKSCCIVLLLLVGLSQSLLAQNQKTPPDLDAIRTAVENRKSAFYYPELMKRFVKADTTLSIDELRAIYYGSSFQPDYSAYASSSAEDTVRAILAYDELLPGDLQRLLVYTDSALQKNPLSMRMLQYRMFAAKKTDNRAIYQVAWRQRDQLLDAILSTGNGLKTSSAFWVTTVSDEYDLLNAIGFEFGGTQQLVDGPCDYLTLKSNDRNVEGLYFNVSISFNQMSEMFGGGKNKQERRKR